MNKTHRAGWEAGESLRAWGRALGPSPRSPAPGRQPHARLRGVRAGGPSPARTVRFSLSRSLFWWRLWMGSPRRKSLLVGGDGGGVLLSPVALPPPLESRLVNRLKPSRNVRDSEPEVGSASAGQTSFAGWRGRGRGSSCGGTSETPGCWERQGEGGGRGPRVGSRAARRREQPPPRAGGLGGLGVLSPRPGRAASARCASSSGELRPCAPCAGHQPGRVLPRAFPILLPSSLNQSPAGSPFLTCFPA